MRLMRMIGLATLGYGAYKAYKSYNASSGGFRRRSSLAVPQRREGAV